MESWEIRADKDAREAAKNLMRFINGNTTDKTAIASFTDEIMRDHRTLQQGLMRYIFALLKAWAKAKKDGWFDLRSEDTVNFAESVAEQLDDTQKPEDVVEKIVDEKADSMYARFI